MQLRAPAEEPLTKNHARDYLLKVDTQAIFPSIHSISANRSSRLPQGSQPSFSTYQRFEYAPVSAWGTSQLLARHIFFCEVHHQAAVLPWHALSAIGHN